MFPAFHYSGYYANDYAINRRLAQQGYVVLAINYRSGIGYGRAFRDAPGARGETHRNIGTSSQPGAGSLASPPSIRSG
jgi:dienelactone hydrolase